MWVLEPNSGPLKEQEVLLTAEPSFHSPGARFLWECIVGNRTLKERFFDCTRYRQTGAHSYS